MPIAKKPGLQKFFERERKNLAKGDFTAFFVFLLLIIVLLVPSMLVSAKMNKIVKAEHEANDELASRLDALTDAHQLLLEEFTTLVTTSDAELEAVKKETAAKLLSAQNDLASTRTELSKRLETQEKGIENVVATWRPRLVRLECKDTANAAASPSRGSGVLTDVAEGIAVYSNRHVIGENADEKKLSCTVSFPTQGETAKVVSEDSIVVRDDKSDFGQILLQNPTEIIQKSAALASESCKERAQIGDQVVIMGFPTIGLKDDVTVTEGIISGYENGYYISSAKVDKGNSGGAAILVKNNCFLGMPTFVTVGKVESLARILDINAI